MDQEELNSARMDTWADQDKYEEKFRLQLTAKHALVVGRWESGEEWGVDLRRWSYDKGRLLGAGVTLNRTEWEWLFEQMCHLHSMGGFTNYGGIKKSTYELALTMCNGFSLHTELFDEAQVPYFCVGLRLGGQPIWRAKGTPFGIIIRFDTISDFIAKVRESGLAGKVPEVKRTRTIDPRTGRELL